MHKKISILWNEVLFDPESKFQKLEDILSQRFSHDELARGLDDLYDPFLLNDMDKVVKRMKQVKENDEKIVIFGDYDVDGVTSTALLVHFFTKIGLQVSYRLPHRVKDGYGMKKYFIDELAQLWVSLVITVDCGTRDLEVIEYAKSLGVDIIVTDHHAVPEIIPKEAVAIINPKRLDSTYPFSGLSGAGVAFKLIQALWKSFFPEKEYKKYLQQSIDIAAIGTVADCMPLIDENRIIVAEGLKQVYQSRSKGIQKLLVDKLQWDIDADIFGFHIWPRLNAAGRLDTPYKALKLLLNNSSSVEEIVDEIEEINTNRKLLSSDFFSKALENINVNDNVIFYADDVIEHGIIGIIAWRITELYFRPSIVLKDEWEKLVASCRSPEYFSIVEYLEKYKEYFLHFGWHKQAAWFSIEKSRFEDFKRDFLQEVNSLDFSNYKKQLKIDKILSYEEYGFWVLETVALFKPYGIGNPKPIFMIEDFELSEVSFLWKGREHIKIKNKYGINILWFGFGEYYDKLKKQNTWNIVIELFEDYWMGKRQLKAKLLDIFF